MIAARPRATMRARSTRCAFAKASAPCPKEPNPPTPSLRPQAPSSSAASSTTSATASPGDSPSACATSACPSRSSSTPSTCSRGPCTTSTPPPRTRSCAHPHRRLGRLRGRGFGRRPLPHRRRLALARLRDLRLPPARRRRGRSLRRPHPPLGQSRLPLRRRTGRGSHMVWGLHPTLPVKSSGSSRASPTGRAALLIETARRGPQGLRRSRLAPCARRQGRASPRSSSSPTVNAIDRLAAGLRAAGEPLNLMLAPGEASDMLERALKGDARFNVVRLPFVPQEEFDDILRAVDGAVIRGEDSFVRAQLAGTPLLWATYPTEDKAHEIKLDAWLARFGRPGLRTPPSPSGRSLRGRLPPLGRRHARARRGEGLARPATRPEEGRRSPGASRSGRGDLPHPRTRPARLRQAGVRLQGASASNPGPN